MNGTDPPEEPQNGSPSDGNNDGDDLSVEGTTPGGEEGRTTFLPLGETLREEGEKLREEDVEDKAGDGDAE